MPPGAKKKKAAKRKKELERKAKLAIQSHHQDQQQLVIYSSTHGNGHHHRHHEENEEDDRDNEARSLTHNSSHGSSHHSSQSEAEDCQEKTGSLMAAAVEEENGVPLVVGVEVDHEMLPTSDSRAKAEDVILDSAADDGAKEEKCGSGVTREAEAVTGKGSEVDDEVPEVASADANVKDEDLEEKTDSAVEVVAMQYDEVKNGVLHDPSAVEVVRQEDEVGDGVPEGNAAVEMVRQDDEVEERAVEETSAIEVMRQIDEVTDTILEEGSAVEVVRQIEEVTNHVDTEMSAVEVVRLIDEDKVLEQKIVKVILPPSNYPESDMVSVPDVGYEAADQPIENPEMKTDSVPNSSGAIIKQPQECHETCCTSNRADVFPATEVVNRAPLVAARAKWWSCCGLFDVFLGSER